MKLLLIWPYFYPEQTAASVRGNAYARYLKQQDINIEVIAPIKKYIEENNKYLYNENNINIPVYRIPLIIHTKDIYLILISFLKLEKLIKRINPDLILSSSTPATITWQTAFLSKKLQIPFIMDVRDPYAQSLKTASYKPILHALARYTEKRSLIQSISIFTVTSQLKKMLIEEYQIPENKIKIVSNGHDFDNIKIFPQNRDNDIVYLGSLSA
jgi:glycosyltransferase involved in cell wall biosynthesis